MQILNRYEYNPQSNITGRGEHSRVYKGIDTNADQPVAIKIFKINDFSDHYRAIRDIDAVKALTHPGICGYLDLHTIEKEDSFGEQEKLQLCITEFMNSGNLVDYYRRHNDTLLLKKLLTDVLQALSYLHANGIIHAYIRPSNIMVTETAGGPVAKLTDFGMGYTRTASHISYSQYPILSAIPYMSPEQLNAHKFGIDEKVAANSDLWSLGAVVYEALTGEPLCTNTGVEFAEAVNAAAPGFEVPEKINNLPAPFKELLQRCLVKDARLRAKKADDLLLLLLEQQPTQRILTLEKKPAATSDGDTLASLAAADENIDATRIIALPKKESNPASLANEKETTMAEDDTRILARAAAVAPESSADDTRIITKIPAPPALIETDDTTIIARQVVNAAADLSNDDTTTLAGTQHVESPSNNTAPQTDVPATTEDTNVMGPGGIDKKQSAGGEEKEPAIVIKKREKPVVLFNRYEYLPASDLIGKGGFSRVYKAFDKKLSRWVALKIYKTGEFSDRYSPIAEIKRVVNLDHPNICRYLDIEEIENENPFGENEKIQVCVMELLDSGNFADYYKTNKNPDVLKKLVQDILNGLSYLHKNGIIHRDIKPGNILIKQTIEGPVAKITDFGISKKSDSVNSNSSSALIVSIPYMAPEQLNAKRYGINEGISFNLDLWSLGVTIYEVIAGKVLFKNSEQDNSEQVMANIMAPGLPEKLNDLPEPFRTVVAHCVIKNARERAARAEELMVLLNSTPAAANILEIMASRAANADNVIENSDVAIEKSNDQPATAAIAAASTSNGTGVDSNTARLRSGFTIADLEEKTVPGNGKRKINILQLTIGIAVLLFIAFVIYIKTGNQPLVVTALPKTPKNDTSHKSISAPVPVKDSAPAGQQKTAAYSDTAATSTHTTPPARTAEKKKEKAAETHKEDPVQEVAKNTGNQKYVLKLTTAQTCTITINSVDYGELQNGQTLKVFLIPGRYILHFTNSSNKEKTYTANIEVKPANLNQVGQFRIPL